MIRLTATGLPLGDSITVHLQTQTIHRTTQITTNLKECGPCPVFVNFTLAFALQLRKKHGETLVRVRKTSVRVPYTHYQTPTHCKTYTHKPTYTHIYNPNHTRPHTPAHNTHTPTHYKTVQVSHALPAVRFSCLLWGRGASFHDGVVAGKGFLCAPF